MHKTLLGIALPVLCWCASVKAETSVVLTAINQDGKRVTVGQLAIEREILGAFGTARRVLLTPEGYQLYVRQNLSFGYLDLPDYVAGLEYTIHNTSPTCSGTYIIDASSSTAYVKLAGFIFPMYHPDILPSVFRVNWNTASQAHTVTAILSEDGVCVEQLYPYEVNGLAIEKIDPTQLGFLAQEPPNYSWLLSEPRWEVRRPTGIFCNGFEGCPQQ